MKKKLLTLVFTLVLLIGLVAAMGMNASAATCPIEGARVRVQKQTRLLLITH